MNANNNGILMIKKMWVENRKIILIALGAYAGFCAILGLWLGWLDTGGGQGQVILYLGLAQLALSVMASMMFGALKTKEGRISLLMCPATAQQKFWPRLLAVVPMALIVVIGGFYLLDLFRVLMELISYGKSVPFSNPFVYIDAYSPYLPIKGMLALGLGATLLSILIYFLGGVVWPRYSFIKTMAALYGLQLFVSIIGALIFRHVKLDFLDNETGLWIITGLIYAACAVVVWLSYIFFRRVTLTRSLSRKK